MTIKKPDGSSYNIGGRSAFNSYRPDGQDAAYLDKLDAEHISITGSEIIYYPCYIDTNYDSLYMESIDSIIAQEGYKIKCYFEPVRPVQELGAFGIDSPDELLFQFNLSTWRSIVKEMPRIKSLIFSSWDKTWWEIIQNDLDKDYTLWKKYRLTVIARKYQASRSDVQPTRRDSEDNSINIY